MEKKTYHNLEIVRLTNLFVGFCYVTGITLACFSYGHTTVINRKVKTTQFTDTFTYDDESREDKIKTPTKITESTQKSSVIDLNDSLVTVDKEVVSDVVVDNIDLGLNKGDTTVIVSDPDISIDIVEDYPDIEAEFIGGDWSRYLLSELRYPEYSLEVGEQGIVYVSFVVDIDGSISDVTVIKSVSSEIDREAKRVIRLSPKWSPGKVRGKPVKTRMVIPINFQIG